MERLICLENYERGLFIIQEQNMEWHNSNVDLRVNPQLENKILNEYWQANFDFEDNQQIVAKTRNFIFRKYIEEDESEVVYVEPIYQYNTTVYIV